MIQANELRIGSFVLLKGETIKWDIQRFWMIEEGVGLYEEDYDPIPLTPEILEKAGFTKEQTYYKDSTWHKRDNIEIHEGGIIFFTDTYENTVQLPVNIQYVHQLQNLYFALTDEELPIEL